MRQTEDTITSHRRAVERVITSARERLCEPISLHDMSRVAYLSEFHFNRVFHQITGLPPAKFISAMRLNEAKRLLLNSNLSITDMCFEVGYNSLSTFTRRFTQRVGLGPREFRYLAERITPASVESLCSHYAELTDRAMQFIAQQKQVTPDKPFFMNLAYGAGHAPHHATPDRDLHTQESNAESACSDFYRMRTRSRSAVGEWKIIGVTSACGPDRT